MDETQSLEKLAGLLDSIAEKPYDFRLHVEHLSLVKSTPGLEDQVQPAVDMFSDYFALPDTVWAPILKQKEETVDLTTSEGCEEVLALYNKAEEDYLSIRILEQHMQFILKQYSRYSGEMPETRPETLGDLFTQQWTRSALAEVVKKGSSHPGEGHVVWDILRDWELECLENTPQSQKSELIAYIDEMFQARLKTIHSNNDETFQAYSSFVTNTQPAQEYESILVAASKFRSGAVKGYAKRDQMEMYLQQSNNSLEACSYYISSERRKQSHNNIEFSVLVTAFERAITEAARRRYLDEPGSTEALTHFWTTYLDEMRIRNQDLRSILNLCQRAVRSVPSSGEIWARYIRTTERTEANGVQTEGLEHHKSVSEIYETALGTSLLQTNSEQIIHLVIARAGFEKRKVEETADESNLNALIQVLESGIGLVRQASKTGDPRLRLENYLSDLYVRTLNLPENAIALWAATAKHYKSSSLAWTSYTGVLIKEGMHNEARAVFQEQCMKHLDWPEALWEAWLAFEQFNGSVEDIDTCLDKIEKATYQVNVRRAKEAEKNAQLSTVAAAIIDEATRAPASQAPESAPMDLDDEHPIENGNKRKADDQERAEAVAPNKKQKMEPVAQPLKRDRENSTVFVSDLPADVKEEELRQLFKDCGNIREVKISQLQDSSIVATIEFIDRSSVPAALTKDKKRLSGDREIAVHLAWKSTLYVTNFPEEADDLSMRGLFDPFGTIFDIRWPSKKFKSSRRFCYVQFTSPAAAERALSLDGRELTPGLKLSVLISDPERKKGRTDQGADEREIYVAGLSKFTAKNDLQRLFSTYGPVKDIRIAQDEEGHAKGFAFVEFEDEMVARAALAANNTELKNRRIAVTMSDPRVKARHKAFVSETGLGKKADTRSRSIRVCNLPPSPQEGVLQQVIEKVAAVKRVEIFLERNEALVELESAAEVGKILLQATPIEYNGHILKITEEAHDKEKRAGAAPSTRAPGLFVPRKARSKPGIGASRQSPVVAGQSGTRSETVKAATSSSAQGGQSAKSQDDFRKML